MVEIVLQYLFYYLTKIISNQISHLACSLIMTILYSLQGTFKNFSHLAQQEESIILEIRLLWVILRPSLSWMQTSLEITLSLTLWNFTENIQENIPFWQQRQVQLFSYTFDCLTIHVNRLVFSVTKLATYSLFGNCEEQLLELDVNPQVDCQLVICWLTGFVRELFLTVIYIL